MSNSGDSFRPQKRFFTGDKPEEKSNDRTAERIRRDEERTRKEWKKAAEEFNKSTKWAFEAIDFKSSDGHFKPVDMKGEKEARELRRAKDLEAEALREQNEREIASIQANLKQTSLEPRDGKNATKLSSFLDSALGGPVNRFETVARDLRSESTSPSAVDRDLSARSGKEDGYSLTTWGTSVANSSARNGGNSGRREPETLTLGIAQRDSDPRQLASGVGIDRVGEIGEEFKERNLLVGENNTLELDSLSERRMKVPAQAARSERAESQPFYAGMTRREVSAGQEGEVPAPDKDSAGHENSAKGVDRDIGRETRATIDSAPLIARGSATTLLRSSAGNPPRVSDSPSGAGAASGIDQGRESVERAPEFARGMLLELSKEISGSYYSVCLSEGEFARETKQVVVVPVIRSDGSAPNRFVVEADSLPGFRGIQIIDVRKIQTIDTSVIEMESSAKRLPESLMAVIDEEVRAIFGIERNAARQLTEVEAEEQRARNARDNSDSVNQNRGLPGAVFRKAELKL